MGNVMKPSRVKQQVKVSVLLTLIAVCGRAETYTWDADAATAGAQDGAGAWSVSDATWWGGVTNKVWQDGKRPWFTKAFHFRFPDIKEIDREAWEVYTRIKNERGDGRLDRYADEIEEENEVKPELTSEQIADMVDEMKLSEQFTLRNTRGRFDSDLIYERFRSMGATKVMARAAAIDLNNRALPV